MINILFAIIFDFLLTPCLEDQRNTIFLLSNIQQNE